MAIAKDNYLNKDGLNAFKNKLDEIFAKKTDLNSKTTVEIIGTKVININIPDTEFNE